MGEDKKEQAKEPEKPPLWLVVIGDSFEKAPMCIKCETPEAFSKAYKDNVLNADGELYVFAFKGERVKLGTIVPMGTVVLDGTTLHIGVDATAVNESGHFIPLIQKPK